MWHVSQENRPLQGSEHGYTWTVVVKVLSSTSTGEWMAVGFWLFWYQIYCSSSNRTDFTQVWRIKHCQFFNLEQVYSLVTHVMLGSVSESFSLDLTLHWIESVRMPAINAQSWSMLIKIQALIRNISQCQLFIAHHTLSQRINYSTWNSNLNQYSTWNSNLSLVFNLEFQSQWG